jgi:hypothetical protein
MGDELRHDVGDADAEGDEALLAPFFSRSSSSAPVWKISSA